MKRPFIMIAVFFFAFAKPALSQRSISQQVTPAPGDKFSIGFGFGQDYGGFGIHAIVYPQQNIGLFGGFGYAIAGAGYNAGVKLRLLPNQGNAAVSPFIVGMYGYNAAIAITNNSQYNKIYYGTTFGAGIDVANRSRGTAKGYFSLAIMVPVRSPDVDAYIDYLKSNGVDFKNNLLPITFSIGYKFIIM